MTKGKLVSSTSISRASFIVLEKLSNMRAMEPIQTPENVPQLFDFIKPKDPRFASAFYKGVSNTLVAMPWTKQRVLHMASADGALSPSLAN